MHSATPSVHCAHQLLAEAAPQRHLRQERPGLQAILAESVLGQLWGHGGCCDAVGYKGGEESHTRLTPDLVASLHHGDDGAPPANRDPAAAAP